MWIYKHSFLVSFCKKLKIVSIKMSLILSMWSTKFYFENLSSRPLNCCPTFLLDFLHPISKLSDKNFCSLTYLQSDVVIMSQAFPYENLWVCLSNILVQKYVRLQEVKSCLSDVFGKVCQLENSKTLTLQNNIVCLANLTQ